MQKHPFGNIFDFEKPVDFCRLSMVILEVFWNINFLFIWLHIVGFYFI